MLGTLQQPTAADWLVYADDSLVIANKPAGLLAVPGRTETDCLALRVQARYPDAMVVHRLDQATSGLMVMARGKANERHISKQFQARTVDKRYQALVTGKLPQAEGQIDLPLAANWLERPRQQVDWAHGKPSRTLWSVLNYDATRNQSRLALVPETGRTHQLRVHLQAIGHPIVGDGLYGGASAQRMMLHACYLALRHPADQRLMQWTSAVPF